MKHAYNAGSKLTIDVSDLEMVFVFGCSASNYFMYFSQTCELLLLVSLILHVAIKIYCH